MKLQKSHDGAGHHRPIAPRRPTARVLAPHPYDATGSGSEPPTGSVSDLGEYWRIIRDRRGIILAVSALVFAAVAIGTLLQTPTYRASGMIEIRKQAVEAVPVETLFEPARISSQYLETQYGVMRSPALARRVAADLRLTEVEEFNPGQRAATRRPDEALDRAMNRLQKRITIDPIMGSNLVQVSVEAEDPELAAQIVNSVVANYLEMRVEAGRTTVDRLAEQVDSARLKLAAAEGRFQEYVRANKLVFLENRTGESENIVHERLRHLQQQLTDAEAERYQKESLYDLVQERGVDFLDSHVLQSLNIRIAELRTEYARLRSTFTDNYPRTKQVKNQLDELEAHLGKERARIAAEIRSGYLAALRREELLRQTFEGQKALMDDLTGKMAEYHILRRDLEGHQQLYSVLQQKRKEAEVSAALATTEIAVVNPAVPPQRPVRPLPRRNLPLAALVGLMLGLGLAFAREYTDKAVKTVEEVDSLSVPLLALIPSVRSLESRRGIELSLISGRRLLSAGPPELPAEANDAWYRIDQQTPGNSALTEAFGSLRTSVLFNAAGPLPQSLLVTSTQPREGKTTVSINLAISLAKLGKRVLLVDADIRRPSVHRAFGLEAHAGLADYLAGEADWRALVRPGVLVGLDVLPSGSPPENPAELLSSGRMGELTSEAEADYDFVILDSPALHISAADTRILAPLVDGVVVVVRSGTTPRDLLRRVLKQAPNLIGVVLNDLHARHLRPYYRDHLTSVGEGGGHAPSAGA